MCETASDGLIGAPTISLTKRQLLILNSYSEYRQIVIYHLLTIQLRNTAVFAESDQNSH